MGLPGKSRLARYLLGQSLETQNRLLTAQDGSNYIAPSLREPIAFHLLIDGVYEKPSIDIVLKHLSPDGVFLDVGANIGVFSITAARLLQNSGKVIAIEASPQIFSYLKKNINYNQLSNIQAVQIAITDLDNAVVDFYEPPSDHFGMGSIARQFHRDPIHIKTKTVDTLLAEKSINSVSVMKVDVEGYEAAVFRGSQSLLHSSHPPIILFEFCDWAEARVPEAKVGDAQRVLTEAGYQIWRLSSFMSGGKPLNKILDSGSEMLVGVKKK
ncbi:FkbM family methyltransferase [Moorena producens]|uniref:FkbM family methyltransferase n=1 Tax=Moorena producens TaxID=1155739 RepID=UPI003C76F24A